MLDDEVDKQKADWTSQCGVQNALKKILLQAIVFQFKTFQTFKN
jgi:hypothetical protein